MKEKGTNKMQGWKIRDLKTDIYIYTRQRKTERIKYVQRNKYIYRILQKWKT